MTTSVHVPKVIKTELLRQRIGDARFERLALEVFGASLIAPKVPREMIEKTLAALEGRLNGHSGGSLVPLAFRAWFVANPKTRARFMGWLKEQLAEADGRGDELNGAEMRQIKAAAKARVAPRKRGRPKGSRNRAKVAR